MTKAEFLKARARMDFEKRVGVTRVAPGEAQGSEVVGPDRRHRFRPNAMRGAAGRLLGHPRDSETGESKPLRSGGVFGLIGQ